MAHITAKIIISKKKYIFFDFLKKRTNVRLVVGQMSA